MTYPALPTFPASTTTSFDDLLAVKRGDKFVVRGYEYIASDDAETWRRNGIETVSIPAKRRHPGFVSGWEAASVLENRAYIGTLDEICPQ